MATNQTSSLTVAPDIRDLKPPIEIPDDLAWLRWTLGLLAVAAILLALWKWWQKRRTQIAYVPPIPAHVRAKLKLDEALALIAQPKPFVIAVSDTARTYLEERFNFRAPERTTEEFLRELAGTDLLVKEQKESLGKFLESCDLVKFAKYEPGENELRALYGSAVYLIDETANTEMPPPLPTTTALTGSQKIKSALSNPANGHLFAIVGILLQVWAAIWLWLFLKTLFELTAAAQSQPGGIKPDDLQPMAQTLTAKFGGFWNWLPWIASFVGLGLILQALSPLHYRARWFFWFVIIFGFLILWAFPIGTLAGIFYISYAWKHRREFTE